jgi:hypothetical protein
MAWILFNAKICCFDFEMICHLKMSRGGLQSLITDGGIPSVAPTRHFLTLFKKFFILLNLLLFINYFILLDLSLFISYLLLLFKFYSLLLLKKIYITTFTSFSTIFNNMLFNTFPKKNLYIPFFTFNTSFNFTYTILFNKFFNIIFYNTNFTIFLLYSIIHFLLLLKKLFIILLLLFILFFYLKPFPNLTKKLLIVSQLPAAIQLIQ